MSESPDKTINNTFDYTQHSYSFGVLPGPKCFKRYIRNGKEFWRNYGHDVQGGISMVDFLAMRMEAAKREIAENLSTRIYG